jgi:hypothetical protein
MRRKIVLLTILVLALFTLYMSDASIEAGQQAWAKWHRPSARAGIVECLICRAHTNCSPTDTTCQQTTCVTECAASERSRDLEAHLR